MRVVSIRMITYMRITSIRTITHERSTLIRITTYMIGRVRSATVMTKDGKLKRPVVKLSPMFYESVFREKNRAGNVGASHQQAKKVDSERAA